MVYKFTLSIIKKKWNSKIELKTIINPEIKIERKKLNKKYKVFNKFLY